MEDSMYKTMAAIAAALAILSLGSLVSAQAGGGATSAPSKYDNASRSASVGQIQHHSRVQSANFRIEEFSSSSARSTAPKR
jgi:hypothetical protein